MSAGALVDLADVRRVVMVDLRGCGRSSRDLPAPCYQPDLCVADAAALVAALGVARVDLLGFSYGGQPAMSFAERHPELVDRLVLPSATAYPGFAEHLAADAEYRRRAPAVDAQVAAILADPAIGEDGRIRRMAFATAPMNLWDLGLLDAWRSVLTQVRFSGEPELGGRAATPLPAAVAVDERVQQVDDLLMTRGGGVEPAA